MDDGIVGRHTTDTLSDLTEGRLHSPSAERNIAAIVDALGPVLTDQSGCMLEIGCGTGQHAAALAAGFPHLDWQPSDPFEVYLASARAWAAGAGVGNIRDPIWLDAAENWPDLGPLAGVIAINVVHITPWVVTRGIFRGAGRMLGPGGVLVFYGPFREGGAHTSESNAGFDQLLRANDPAWGVRDIDDLSALARECGLGPADVTVMPSYNRLVAFRRP